MPPDSALVLTLDLGTSSTRTALFDAQGRRFTHTTAQQAYPLVTSVDGAAELEPAVLSTAVLRCLQETMRQYRADARLRGRPIAGIGVSSFWHSLIALDAKGRPLTRIITWADGRCRDDAAHLRKEFSEKAVHARTGCMLRSSFWPAKLVWLKRTQPRLFAKVHRWVSPAEWIQLELCGDASCAIGMATGTGMFDPTKLDWDAALLRRCALDRDHLNALSDEPVTSNGRLAALHAELRGVPWFPAIGDGAASNLGSGATRPGFAAINVGTSAALRVMREGKKARAPFGLFCYRVDAKRFLVGGAISNAGNLRAWCLRELRLPEDAALEAQLERRDAPSHGLTVLPFWAAERAPTWNEDLRGVIHGVNLNTTALDILQATTEAAYIRIAQIGELVVAEEPAPPKFLVSGGIQHSRSSMQRLADVLGHAIYANPEAEASIRGAAIFALERLGYQPAALKLGRAIRPRAKIAALYAKQRQRQAQLEQFFERIKA